MLATFGEIMMRLSPPGHQRFIQARTFEVTYGGGEANVAVSASILGLPSRLITRLPANNLGHSCESFVRQYGVDTSRIVWGGDRLGIYFHEFGSVQRGAKVVYDRAGSALATIEPGMVDWEKAFDGATRFHYTGITPAVSQGAAEACLEGIRKAREKGLTVSCDLNFRAKLWKWGKTAGEIMPEMVGLTDLVVGNEEDAEKVLGIKAPGADVTTGKVSGEQYRFVAEEIIRRYPNVQQVAITLRGSISASHNTWSALYFDGKSHYQAPVYQITHIVDRVGGGDAFVAGLLFALNQFPEDSQRAVDFATAASCLKHSIVGDFNLATRDEVEKLMKGDASGRVSR